MLGASLGLLGLPSGQHGTTVDSQSDHDRTEETQVEDHVDLLIGGGPPGIRTPDLLSKSQQLYR
jgi:hypothetical protein